VTQDPASTPEVPGLPPEVTARITTELRNGDDIIEHLSTAALLIADARGEAIGLRLAESAAYNIREALDRVVQGQAARSNGVSAVTDAWKRYKIALAGPAAGSEAEFARAELEAAIDRIAGNEERQAYKTQKLMSFLRLQTGVEPLPGQGDPAVLYSRLRTRANAVLHERGTLPAVASIYEETVAWFIQLFTPPDARVRAIIALAECQFSRLLIDELRAEVVNAHHVRLFLTRIRDPNWLGPLCDAGLIALPREGEPWPVHSLVDNPQIQPTEVARLLDRLLGDMTRAAPSHRLMMAREILHTAWRLGAAGYAIGSKIIAKYPTDHWVQMVAVGIAKDAEASDPIQVVVADAILGRDHTTHDAHNAHRVLKRLVDGLAPDNLVQRVGLVAAKVRRLARREGMRFVVLDTAALGTQNDHSSDLVLILTQHLVSTFAVARQLGLPTAELLESLRDISGELGERIVCQALAGADDVERELKIRHLERRLISETATGDDRDLIEDILRVPLSREEVVRMREAFGEPSPVAYDDDGAETFGENWARGWRWSLILPKEILEAWERPIAIVTEARGTPSRRSLDTRVSPVTSWGSSPYNEEELLALDVQEAADLVSRWRPSTADPWGVSARELARTLEAVVKNHPREWTVDPSAVVRALREPVYVNHYFRAVGAAAGEVPERANTVIAAVHLASAERWEPTPLGRDDFEYDQDWSGVETSAVEMIAAFANKDGEIGQSLNGCWELSLSLLRQVPVELPVIDPAESSSRSDDPLNRAINRPYGHALDAVLALAGWEHRNMGAASDRLAAALDWVLGVPGTVGVELRAILARSRPFLETVGRDWLDRRAKDLFPADVVGVLTFDQTLKWSRPTPWFLARYREDLCRAARRGAEHALSWLLIGYLWDESGYTFHNLLSCLAGESALVRTAAEEIASLLQDLDSTSPVVEKGIQFWTGLLEADRRLVPLDSLPGLGRWTFVTAVADSQWFDLTCQTIELTSGEIDMSIEIADRCKAAQPLSQGLRMLRLMIGHGAPWEQRHIEDTAVDALREAAQHRVDEEFYRLRNRLIDRGRHEAEEVRPPEIP